MTKRKAVPKKMVLNPCASRYDIQCKNGYVYKNAKISFITPEGYFAAVFPDGCTKDNADDLVGAKLFEAREKKSAEYAGEILKCSQTAVYGRIKSLFINRARNDHRLDLYVFPIKKAEPKSVTSWNFRPYGDDGGSFHSVKHGELCTDNNGEFYYVCKNDDTDQYRGDIVIYQYFEAFAIISDVSQTDPHTLKCIPLEIVAGELCELINERAKAIKMGLLPKEEKASFIIHDGVLEQYEGSESTVKIPEGVRVIGRKAFYFNDVAKEIYVPDTVEIIEDCAFWCCSRVEKIDLPDSVREIGRSAFSGCLRLKSIVVPPKVTEIKDHTFDECRSLENVVLPNGLLRINNSAFSWCLKLRRLDIPKSVVFIGNYVFTLCKRLEKINIPAHADVGNTPFQKTKWLKNFYAEHDALIVNGKIICANKKLKEYTIPDNVHTIGGFAFCCNKAEKINIPDSVKEIREFAFASSNIKSIVIPDSVNLIDEYAFSECKSLENVVIPPTVKNVADNAFHVIT